MKTRNEKKRFVTEEVFNSVSSVDRISVKICLKKLYFEYLRVKLFLSNTGSEIDKLLQLVDLLSFFERLSC